MEEQKLTYKVGSLAKEKGFDEYDVYTEENIPQSLVQKWLRDKHDIDIEIEVFKDPETHIKFYEVGIYADFLEEEDDNTQYDTYEEALEDAILEALELIQ